MKSLLMIAKGLLVVITLASCSSDNKQSAFSENAQMGDAESLVDLVEKPVLVENQLDLNSRVKDGFIELSWTIDGLDLSSVDQFKVYVSDELGSEVFYTQELSYGYITAGIQTYSFQVAAISQDGTELFESELLTLTSSKDRSDQSDTAP